MKQPTDRVYDEHVRLWTDMLGTFISWTPTQVERWAVRYKAGIADQNSDFYHKTPEHYAAQLLVSLSLHKRLVTADHPNFARKIERFCSDVVEKATSLDDIDWKPVREKIDKLLSQYGESLDNVAKEKADWFLGSPSCF